MQNIIQPVWIISFENRIFHELWIQAPLFLIPALLYTVHIHHWQSEREFLHSRVLQMPVKEYRELIEPSLILLLSSSRKPVIVESSIVPSCISAKSNIITASLLVEIA